MSSLSLLYGNMYNQMAPTKKRRHLSLTLSCTVPGCGNERSVGGIERRRVKNGKKGGERGRGKKNLFRFFSLPLSFSHLLDKQMLMAPAAAAEAEARMGKWRRGTFRGRWCAGLQRTGHMCRERSLKTVVQK